MVELVDGAGILFGEGANEPTAGTRAELPIATTAAIPAAAAIGTIIGIVAATLLVQRLYHRVGASKGWKMDNVSHQTELPASNPAS